MKKWIFVCCTILLFAITASAQDTTDCDGSETENRRGRAVADGNTSTTCPTTTPTPQPANGPTSVPTAGATPSGPTPIPTAGVIRSKPIYIDIQGMPFITETFEFTELSSIVTLSYPENWTVKPDEFGGFNITNDPDLLEENADTEIIPEGSVYLLVTTFDEELISIMVDGDNEVTPETILDSFVNLFATSEAEEVPEFGDIEITTINDKPTAIVTGTIDDNEAIMIIVELEQDYVFAFGGTAIGELDDNIDIIHAIAGSLTIADAE